MKILCPIDFSPASINAVEYAFKLAGELDASLVELTHCIYSVKNFQGGVVPASDNGAQEEIKKLESKYSAKSTLNVGSSVFKGHPLDVLSPYIKAMEHDLIVVGTRGLTPVRDLTIGSFTEDLIFSIDRAVLVVPEGSVFTKIGSIVLATDAKILSNQRTLHPLFELLRCTNAQLHIVHVSQPGESAIENLSILQQSLGDVEYSFYSVPVETTVTDTLDEFVEEHNADVLCMIHRDRGWMINIFS